MIIEQSTYATLKSLRIRKNEIGLLFENSMLSEILIAGNYKIQPSTSARLHIVKSGELFNISKSDYEILRHKAAENKLDIEPIKIGIGEYQICIL